VLESRERKSLVSGLWLIDEGEDGSPGNTVFEDPASGSPFLALIGVPLTGRILDSYLRYWR